MYFFCISLVIMTWLPRCLYANWSFFFFFLLIALFSSQSFRAELEMCKRSKDLSWFLSGNCSYLWASEIEFALPPNKHASDRLLRVAQILATGNIFPPRRCTNLWLYPICTLGPGWDAVEVECPVPCCCPPFFCLHSQLLIKLPFLAAFLRGILTS